MIKSKIKSYLFLLCFLYWTLQILVFVCLVGFDKLEVCGNPVPSKSICTIFPIAVAHFVSLCHILVVLTIFPSVSTSSLLQLLWWSVISDFFYVTVVIILRGHELHPYKTVNLIEKFFLCSDCSTKCCCHLSLWASLSPETQKYWNNFNITL